MQVTKEGIEAVKAASDLAAVVAERGVRLQKKGRTLLARCPFHDDETPSFVVTPQKGLFHCFGCGVGGDVIGFVTRHDRVSFGGALETLARRAGLDLRKLMEPRPRILQKTPHEALTPAAEASGNGRGAPSKSAPAALARVVEHYHRCFCEREDAQAYLARRGLTDADLLRVLKAGYADGSLLKLVPKTGGLRDELVKLGVVTKEGRELLGGCVVVPIPDPLTGAWVNLYGRGVKTPRHCYLPGPFRGVLNFQAARASSEIVLTESVLDALSFLQAGVATAIPLYGTNGFTADHLDLLKREGVARVVLALDGDAAGKKATDSLKRKLETAGVAVRIASFPEGIKDANELLVSRNGDAFEAFRRLLDAAEPRGEPQASPAVPTPSTPVASASPTPAATGTPAPAPASHSMPAPSLRMTSATATVPPACVSSGEKPAGRERGAGERVLVREGVTYRARVYPPLLGRLRATVKAEGESGLHVDSLDLYASRSRAEFARRAAKALGREAGAVEAALLELLVEAERALETVEVSAETPEPPAMTEAEREEALAFLRRPDLLDQVARDVDSLGYVGEETNKRLLYLVAVSRKLEDPLSAIVMSQSGAGKSGLTEAIERLTPPEDVVLLTRLTPQSLYYTEPGFLDRKLVIVEERYGSIEADYSIRVLQSRKKLIAAAPIKDPQTGNLRTRVFTVEARAAFIEATTASSVNHENATRCFELAMDESREQTERIHARQRLVRTERGLALRQAAEAISRRHWNAQRLLEPLPVVIPYAERLSFPSAWMRTRRDHARFLNLIEVSAFLHQHQREKKGGAILASLADYAVAHTLAGEVLADTLQDLRKPLREAYARIREISLKSGSVSRSEVRDALGLPDSTVRRWLSELCELEYLEAQPVKQGKPARYVLSGRTPRAALVVGLLPPEELRHFATTPPRPVAGS